MRSNVVLGLPLGILIIGAWGSRGLANMPERTDEQDPNYVVGEVLAEAIVCPTGSKMAA